MVAPKAYLPDRGHLIWLSFNPQKGHEQAGHRPALVISPKSYNRKVGLGLFCPITSKVKGYPFEVLLPKRSQISGAILSDQLKSLDWRARNAQFIESIPDHIFKKVQHKVKLLID